MLHNRAVPLALQSPPHSAQLAPSRAAPLPPPDAAQLTLAMARTRSAAAATAPEPEREDTGMVLPPVPSMDDRSKDPAVRLPCPHGKAVASSPCSWPAQQHHGQYPGQLHAQPCCAALLLHRRALATAAQPPRRACRCRRPSTLLAVCPMVDRLSPPLKLLSRPNLNQIILSRHGRCGT